MIKEFPLTSIDPERVEKQRKKTERKTRLYEYTKTRKKCEKNEVVDRISGPPHFFASRYIGQEKAVALLDTIRFPKLDTILLLFVII